MDVRYLVPAMRKLPKQWKWFNVNSFTAGVSPDPQEVLYHGFCVGASIWQTKHSGEAVAKSASARGSLFFGG